MLGRAFRQFQYKPLQRQWPIVMQQPVYPVYPVYPAYQSHPISYQRNYPIITSDNNHTVPSNVFECSTHYYDSKQSESNELLKSVKSHEGCVLSNCDDTGYDKHCAYYCTKGGTVIYLSGGMHDMYSLTDFDFWMIDRSDILLSENTCDGKYKKYGSSESIIYRTFVDEGKDVVHIDQIRNEEPYQGEINKFLKRIGYTTIEKPMIVRGRSRVHLIENDMTNIDSNKFNAVDGFWVQTIRNNVWKMEYIDRLCKNNTTFLTCGAAHLRHLVKLLEEDDFEIYPVPIKNDVCIPRSWNIGL
jgi:hypothetical protein